MNILLQAVSRVSLCVKGSMLNPHHVRRGASLQSCAADSQGDVPHFGDAKIAHLPPQQ
jgi:hypothetical protein